MSSEELQELLVAGEGERLEFKQEAIKPSDLAETLVAFANSRGGTVLLGVNDRGEATGLRRPNVAQDLVLTAASRELCDPPLRLRGISLAELAEGVQVLVVTVRRSRQLHATHGRFLVRRGARNVALSTVDVTQRSRRSETGEVATVQLASGYQGLYEVLRYDIRLELLDAKGEQAVLEREEEIRFLQDGVVAIYDQVWGAGEQFADYQVEPGVVADRFRLGSRQVTLVSLRQIKNRGETLRLRVRRRISRGWTAEGEWFETAINHRTRSLRLTVTFPAECPPKEACVVEETTGSSRKLDRRHWRTDEQGRTVLAWRKRAPALGERYLLRWRW